MYPNYPKTNFFGASLIFIKVGGQYVPRPDESLAIKLFSLCYNTFWILFCQVYYTPTELMMLGVTINVPSNFIEHIGMISMHFLGMIKLCIWFTKRKVFISIMKVLNDDAFKYEDCGEFKPGNIVGSNQKLYNRIGLIFFIMGSFVPLSKTIGAFFDFRVRGHLIESGNITCFEILPYFAWFPFETETSKGCGLALVVQMFPMLVYAWQIIAYDMLFSGLSLSVRAHLRVIQGAFKSMRERSLAALDLPDNYEVFKDADNEALKSQMSKEMRKTSVHLQTVINVCQEMENSFYIGSLAQASVAMFVMISCLYVVSIEPMFSPAATAEIHFFISAVAQLSFYCTFGNEITYESLNINGAIYEVDWYSAETSFKTSMLINMQRMQIPIFLTVGKFTPWTLSTLITILRGSYSYFTVLKQST